MAFHVDGDGFYVTKKRVVHDGDPPTVCDGVLVYGRLGMVGPFWPFKRKVLYCVSIPVFPPPDNEPLAYYVMRNFIGRPGMTYDMKGKLIPRLSYFSPENLERRAEAHEYASMMALLELDDGVQAIKQVLPWNR